MRASVEQLTSMSGHVIRAIHANTSHAISLTIIGNIKIEQTLDDFIIKGRLISIVSERLGSEWRVSGHQTVRQSEHQGDAVRSGPGQNLMVDPVEWWPLCLKCRGCFIS